MESEILLDGGSGVIGIAILASVQAAVVHADIDACHAAAFFPLVLILGQRQGLTNNAFQQFTVDTMPVTDAKPGLMCYITNAIRNINGLHGVYYSEEVSEASCTA